MTHEGSYYGQVRRTAYALWRGPHYLRNRNDTNFLGGSCVLRLAMRQRTSTEPQIEARAVYASLKDEAQSDAVLRAVYWDSRTVIHNSSPEATPIKIPARFVQTSIIQAKQWIKMFDGFQTTLRVFPQTDDTLTICSLRIETDSVYRVFEKVWQVTQGEYDELNRLWQVIWQQMGQALQTLPTIAVPEETFPRVDGDPSAYDFQAYSPTLKIS